MGFECLCDDVTRFGAMKQIELRARSKFTMALYSYGRIVQLPSPFAAATAAAS